MLDIQFIRDNKDLVAKKSKQKGYEVDIDELLRVDKQRRDLLTEIEQIRAEKNALAKSNDGISVSRAEHSPGRDPEKIEKGKRLKEKENELESKLNPVSAQIDKLLKTVPNMFPDDTPIGDESASKEVKKWGNTGAKSFAVEDHVSWAEERGLLDFERGAKVAGNKFYFELGGLVELEQAVFQYAMQLARQHNFVPISVPHMVNTQIIEGTGFLAKGDEEQIYKVQDEDLHLIATAEIPITGFHSGEILDINTSPKLYAGISPAYRREAGAYGKHSKGLYRVHQFNKLELYVFCKPEDSEHWHQELLAIEEEICQALEIPYRMIRIASGDLGAPAYKKFDIEYWSPAENTYRELMSCSNVTDYQARRLAIRYRADKGKTEFVHTLNGTAAAYSRVCIALIENHQQQDGKVQIPAALRPYIAGQTNI